MPAGERVVYSPQLCYFRLNDEDRLSRRFLSLWFRSAEFVRQASHRANNTDMAPYINLADIRSLEIEVPPIATQRGIVEVLGAFDDKIAANRRVVAVSGELMDTALSEALASGSTTKSVGDIADFHNRRRVPLSGRERELRVGGVPYYGAAGLVGFVDDQLFDEPLVLVGEDGTVVTDDGTAVVQYVWGPSWVNNHAHVLTGRTVSTELLAVIARRTRVSDLVTGAVQPKLSMGNLKRAQVVVPTEVAAVEHTIHALSGSARALSDETARLAATRDGLLPLLMSGKLTVKGAEKCAGEVL